MDPILPAIPVSPGFFFLWFGVVAWLESQFLVTEPHAYVSYPWRVSKDARGRARLFLRVQDDISKKKERSWLFACLEQTKSRRERACSAC